MLMLTLIPCLSSSETVLDISLPIALFVLFLFILFADEADEFDNDDDEHQRANLAQDFAEHLSVCHFLGVIRSVGHRINHRPGVGKDCALVCYLVISVF